RAQERTQLDDTCSMEDLTREAVWIQENLTGILNQHARPVRITPRSERWWNQEIKEARTAYSRARRAEQEQAISTQELKDARNSYYRTIRRTKRACWEAFLGGPADWGEQLGTDDTARCWQALGYTKPKSTTVTPTLHGPQGQLATTISEKEA